MIRVTCPKCEKKLGVDDAAAGTVITCPACKHKFPVAKPAPAEVPSEVRVAKKSGVKKAVAAPNEPEPPKPDPLPIPLAAPTPAESGVSYAVAQEPEPPPEKKKKRRKGKGRDEEEEEIADEDVGLDAAYLKRRKKKRQKATEGQLISGVSNFTLVMTPILLGWIALVALQFLPSLEDRQKILLAGLLFWMSLLVGFGAFVWLVIAVIVVQGTVMEKIGKPLVLGFVSVLILVSFFAMSFLVLAPIILKEAERQQQLQQQKQSTPAK